jgi:hypothetical protein
VIWPNRYEDRLSRWLRLREDNRDNDLETALLNINDWWQQPPWVPYYLHWDDMEDWPDPWDLLADNHFCSVAKALGIVYTLHMISRPDITTLQMAVNRDSADNLVLVNEGKYILNWTQGQLVNITSPNINIIRAVDSSAVTKKIN